MKAEAYRYMARLRRRGGGSLATPALTLPSSPRSNCRRRGPSKSPLALAMTLAETGYGIHYLIVFKRWPYCRRWRRIRGDLALRRRAAVIERAPTGLLNALLTGIFGAESSLLARRLRLACGLSLLAVVAKSG